MKNKINRKKIDEMVTEFCRKNAEAVEIICDISIGNSECVSAIRRINPDLLHGSCDLTISIHNMTYKEMLYYEIEKICHYKLNNDELEYAVKNFIRRIISQIKEDEWDN